MLQYPAFMTQYPWSTRMIPASFLLPAQCPLSHNEELLLAMEESDFEEKEVKLKSGEKKVKHRDPLILCNEIRKISGNFVVIGKTTADNDKEDYENDADDDEADNAEESEGDEFEQETG